MRATVSAAGIRQCTSPSVGHRPRPSPPAHLNGRHFSATASIAAASGSSCSGGSGAEPSCCPISCCHSGTLSVPSPCRCPPVERSSPQCQLPAPQPDPSISACLEAVEHLHAAADPQVAGGQHVWAACREGGSSRLAGGQRRARASQGHALLQGGPRWVTPAVTPWAAHPDGTWRACGLQRTRRHSMAGQTQPRQQAGGASSGNVVGESRAPVMPPVQVPRSALQARSHVQRPMPRTWQRACSSAASFISAKWNATGQRANRGGGDQQPITSCERQQTRVAQGCSLCPLTSTPCLDPTSPCVAPPPRMRPPLPPPLLPRLPAILASDSLPSLKCAARSCR